MIHKFGQYQNCWKLVKMMIVLLLARKIMMMTLLVVKVARMMVMICRSKRRRRSYGSNTFYWTHVSTTPFPTSRWPPSSSSSLATLGPGRVRFSRVNFTRLASRLLRSAQREINFLWKTDYWETDSTYISTSPSIIILMTIQLNWHSL